MHTAQKEIWIFLSHSNKDYEKVRQVRNMLEEQDLRPLMFFLHCLNDDDEIDELIKREIDCRTRFILCDSENAQSSKWVQKEVEYIKSKDRMYETIDLSKSIEDIENDLMQFIAKTRIFVSYNREEVNLAKKFALRINKYDFSVYMDMLWDATQTYQQDYAKETIRQLDSSVENGIVVAFINERIFKSANDIPGSSRYELLRAIEIAKQNKFTKVNTIVFVKNNDVMVQISKDKDLSPLCNGIIVSLDSVAKEHECDFAIETVLHELLPEGSILTQAKTFAEGRNNEKDEEEATWLTKMIRKTLFKPTLERKELENDSGTFVCNRNRINGELTLLEFIPNKTNLVENQDSKFVVRNLIIPYGIHHFCDDCLRGICVTDEFKMPDTIISIGSMDGGASHGCVFADSDLPEVVIPQTIETIGIFAFGNSKIKKLVLPPGNASLYARQFKDAHIATLCVSRDEWEHSGYNSYIYNFFVHAKYDKLELY